MARAVNLKGPAGELKGIAFEELDDERVARIARENTEHAHKLWKDKIVFALVVAAGTLLFLICGYILLFGGSAVDPGSRDLARIGITALFTSLVSFLAGQRMK